MDEKTVVTSSVTLPVHSGANKRKLADDDTDCELAKRSKVEQLVYEYPPVEFSDLKLECGGAIFRVHKMLLAACSPVFRDALLQDSKCQQLDLSGRTDHSIETLTAFLNNLYQLLTPKLFAPRPPSLVRVKELAQLGNFYNCATVRAQCDRDFLHLIETVLPVERLWEELLFCYKLQLVQSEQWLTERVVVLYRDARNSIPPARWQEIVGQLPTRLTCKVLDLTHFVRGWELEAAKIEGEEKQALRLFAFGSDNPEALVGLRIGIQLNELWWKGVIDGYRGIADEHRITFDDGDKRLYKLRLMTWRILGSKFVWRAAS